METRRVLWLSGRAGSALRGCLGLSAVTVAALFGLSPEVSAAPAGAVAAATLEAQQQLPGQKEICEEYNKQYKKVVDKSTKNQAGVIFKVFANWSAVDPNKTGLVKVGDLYLRLLKCIKDDNLCELPEMMGLMKLICDDSFFKFLETYQFNSPPDQQLGYGDLEKYLKDNLQKKGCGEEDADDVDIEQIIEQQGIEAYLRSLAGLSSGADEVVATPTSTETNWLPYESPSYSDGFDDAAPMPTETGFYYPSSTYYVEPAPTYYYAVPYPTGEDFAR